MTSASAILASIESGPAERSVCAAGVGGGIAPCAPTVFSPAPAWSLTIGSTGLGLAFDASGGALWSP